MVSVEDKGSQETDTDCNGQYLQLSPLEQVDSAISAIPSERSSLSSASSGSFSTLLDPGYFNHAEHASGTMPVYRGKTTGVDVVRGLRELCDTFAGFSIHSDSAAAKIADALDVGTPAFHELPAVSSAGRFFSPAPSIRRWVDLAFSEAFILWPFIDQDSFNDQVRKLIESGGSNENGWDKDRIGLLHAVIALGQRHDLDLIEFEGKRSQSKETRG